MDIVADVLILLLLVVVSDFIERLLPRALPLPRPLIQILLGGAVALSGTPVPSFEPEVFFLLFLPPLLFLDGWRIPPEELFQEKGTVVQLALGLVIFTVLGVGTFIHFLLPAMPLSVAFALAAVLSPTDAIAVSDIARRVTMPRRMKRILQGECLLNDASGLVCFRLAVAATLTGAFSLPAAALDFAYNVGAAVVAGVGLTLILSGLKNHVSRHLGEDSGAQILISLLIPFGCWLLAERLHASGVLAVAAAGLTMSFVEHAGHAEPTTRIRRSTFWDLIQFSANGVIFVLLGEQLPGIVGAAADTALQAGHTQPLWLLAAVIAISAALVLLRATWVLVTLRVRWFRRRAAQAGGTVTEATPWRLMAAMSLAGVRGAVTLAGVLSLPLLLPSGDRFPARDLAVLLAMGVIVVSVLTASVALPLLLRGLELPDDPARAAEEAAARTAAAQAAVGALEQLERERLDAGAEGSVDAAAAARVIAAYRARIERHAGDAAAMALAQGAEAAERQMQLAGLRAERAEIQAQVKARRLGSATARRLIRELDLHEARLAST